jgi:acetyltransferase-like isoleucine patch superfamily enzyme
VQEKIGNYVRRFGVYNTIRKSVYVVLRTLGKVHFRKIKAILYFKSSTLNLGRHVKIDGMVNRIKIGKCNTIYDYGIFHFNSECHFETGDHVIFSYHVLVTCEHDIRIGSYVQIGEFTSIRDSTHDYTVEGNMMGSEDKKAPILIGNNVWIGRGCLICEGSIIEDGVVVAAHSVVKGRLLKDTIYGGVPAKAIKNRLEGIK